MTVSAKNAPNHREEQADVPSMSWVDAILPQRPTKHDAPHRIHKCLTSGAQLHEECDGVGEFSRLKPDALPSGDPECSETAQQNRDAVDRSACNANLQQTVRIQTYRSCISGGVFCHVLNAL